MPKYKCNIFFASVLFHSTMGKKFGKISCQIIDTLKATVKRFVRYGPSNAVRYFLSKNFLKAISFLI